MRGSLSFCLVKADMMFSSLRSLRCWICTRSSGSRVRRQLIIKSDNDDDSGDDDDHPTRVHCLDHFIFGQSSQHYLDSQSISAGHDDRYLLDQNLFLNHHLSLDQNLLLDLPLLVD